MKINQFAKTQFNNFWLFLKRACAKAWQFVKANPTQFTMLVICLVLFGAVARLSTVELLDRLGHELKEVGNWDSYLYYTVGHGMTEGLVPYAQMYENKPPLIFLLASLSWTLFGNYYLLNVISFLSLVTVLIAPVSACVYFLTKNKVELTKSLVITLFTLSASLLLTFFAQHHSAQAQIELLASGPAVLCVILGLAINTKTTKWYSPCIILCGACFGVSTMLKEPFALICLVCLLMLVKDGKSLFKVVILPGTFAVCTAFLILATSNCFIPYFSIYLKNMFSSHISIYGSPFERMLNVKTLFDYAYGFNKVIPLVYLIVWALSTASFVCTEYSENVAVNVIKKCVFALEPTAFLFVASFCVGLGGQYYNHHYVFATPFFLALLIKSVQFLARQKTPFFTKVFAQTAQSFDNDCNNAEKTKIVSKKFLQAFAVYPLVFVFCLLCCNSFTKPQNYKDDFKNVEIQSELVKIKAKYLDDILYCVNQETYLWLGFNGYNPYAHTKHLPSGPCFVQDAHNFSTADTFFAQEFLKQLETANVLVLQSTNVNLGAITDQTRDYINKNFTFLRPQSLVLANLEKPDCVDFYIMFRTTAFS